MKIADFGISKMTETGEKFNKIGGTKMFLPPETWKGGSFDGVPVDIWALGITFFFLAFEFYPFQSTDYINFNKVVENTDIKYPDNADPLFVNLLNKMIIKDPSKRASLYELFEDEWITKDQKKELPRLEGVEIIQITEEEAKNALTRRKIEINMFAFSKMKTKIFRVRSRSRVAEE